MKNALSHILLVALLIGWTTITLPTNAAPPVESTLEPADVAADNPASVLWHVETYRWFINFGTTTRTINTDFRFDGRQTTLDWNRYVTQRSGRGNVGLYRGGRNATLYDDGYVGPPSQNIAGAAGGYVNSPRQISNHPMGNQNRVVTFHTDDYHYRTSLNRNTANASDSDVGVGPYFQFGYHLKSIDSLIINFVTGGSYIRTKHSSGNHYVANLTVTERHTTYNYQYDYAANPALPPLGPGRINGQDQIIIYDPSMLPGGRNLVPLNPSYYRPPRQSDSTATSMVTRFYAMSHANLDVNLNEIPVGFEIGRQVGPVDIFFIGGTTVNIIDYNLSNSLTWYQEGRSSPIMSQRWHDSGTPVRLGFYSGLAIKVPLKRDGRIYVEAHGSYRWVDPLHVSAGIVDVTIDPSSWESGIGIVIILD